MSIRNLVKSIQDILQAEDDVPALAAAQEDTTITEAALAALESTGPDALAQALAVLRDNTREWWKNEVEEDACCKPEAESLYGLLLVHARPKMQCI